MATRMTLRRLSLLYNDISRGVLIWLNLSAYACAGCTALIWVMLKITAVIQNQEHRKAYNMQNLQVILVINIHYKHI